MVKSFLNLFLKLLSMGTVTLAAFLWADAAVDDRPKYRDEQTLIGGMIWSQMIILLGLIMSDAIGEQLHIVVHSYYLLSGSVLCGFTGLLLLVDEYKRRSIHRDIENDIVHNVDVFKDKIYLSIGLVSCVACILTSADFIALLYFNQLI